MCQKFCGNWIVKAALGARQAEIAELHKGALDDRRRNMASIEVSSQVRTHVSVMCPSWTPIECLVVLY